MVKLGYARVSTTDQSTAIQVMALKAAGCSLVREERATGTSLTKRPELRITLDFLRPGDALVVTRIDRLARSVLDLAMIMQELKAKSCALIVTEQSINTGTAAGKAFLDMLGVFAEFETNLRRERQAEGIAKAKLTGGKYLGRPSSVDPTMVQALRREGLTPSQAAKHLGLSRSTIYRHWGATDGAP